MKDEILRQLKLRQGMPEDKLLMDMVDDCVVELKGYLNYGVSENLPNECIPIIKQLVLIKVNRNGTEGIQSENYSGVSTAYLTDIPMELKRQIRRYRKLVL